MNKLAGILSFMVVLLGMTSCMEDEGDMEPISVAYVSIFHASPDAPDLDVVLDDQPIFNEPLEYTDFANYRQFYTGERELAFNAYNASNVLADTTFDFQENKVYSVFVINDLADLSTLIVEDKADTPESGKALVRFVQLSPDAPALDFSVGEDSLLFTNQEFKQATDFTEVDADTYALALKTAGEDDTLVSVPDAELISGRIYTVIARGFTNTPAGNTNGLSIQIIQNQ
ncbi:MAG: DUF4397 domain-containing protein [Cyclobacteriaceae bacterium]